MIKNLIEALVVLFITLIIGFRIFNTFDSYSGIITIILGCWANYKFILKKTFKNQ